MERLILWAIPVAFVAVLVYGAEMKRRYGPVTCYVNNLYDIHCKQGRNQ